MPKKPQRFETVIKRFQAHPEEWLKETFGAELWDKQLEILHSVWNNRYTACKSCYASGKSYLAATLVLAWTHLFPDSIVFTTGPSARQVKYNVWQNVAQIYRDARAELGSELLQTELRCGPGWYATGFSTDDPELIQGLHAKSGRILIIVDESAAVDPKIHERIAALMTSEKAHRFDIGNPLEPTGPFYDMFQDPLVQKFTISAYDTPNVRDKVSKVPGLVTKQWVDERLDKWGAESPLFLSSVLGEFPQSAEDSLFPLSWIRLAQERWYEVEPGQKSVYGLDPGGGGLAESVLCCRSDRYIHPLHVGVGYSSPQIVGMIPAYADPSSKCYIDSIGVGFGVLGQAKENNYNVEGVNVQTSSSDKDRFVNLRSQLYWILRERLDPDGPYQWALPPDDDVLASQLGAIRYRIADSGGKVQIESKKEMKSRGLPSPDRADAVMLTCMAEFYSDSAGAAVGVGRSHWHDEDLGPMEELASGWGNYI